MFEKYETWAFPAPSAGELFRAAWDFFARSGYALAGAGPGSFIGRSFYPRLGIHRRVDITVLPQGSGGVVQMRFRADVTEEGIAVGAVAAVIFLPVAAVGAAISWHEYETDWIQVRQGLWGALALHARTGALPPPPPPPPPSPTPSAPLSMSGTTAASELTCASCGGAAPAGAAYCPSCGKALGLKGT
jgi:hypothetical protein